MKIDFFDKFRASYFITIQLYSIYDHFISYLFITPSLLTF
jgi:hypothetical protein